MEQSELLAYLIEALDRLHLSYLLTGSVATSYYGEPRFTNDIDVIVELTSTDATNFCESFPNDEFYLSTEAVHLAITEQRQFNIIHPTTGLKIDVFVLNDSAFEQSRFRRRKKHELEKALLAWFATPEDVILKKLVYYNEGESEKHIRDIIGVLKIQGKLIDYAYLSQWANQLNLSELWQDVLAQSETDQRKTDDAS